MNIFATLCCLFLMSISGCSKNNNEAEIVVSAISQGESMFELTSPAFNQGASIPSRYTCDGENVSPELSWKNAPANTQSFALICDDPDALHGTFVHWVIYNIPATTTHLPEGARASGEHGIFGKTSFNANKFGGPCPPSGTHRYFFKIYALDKMLDLSGHATKEDVERSMKGHILAQNELMGTYQRSK